MPRSLLTKAGVPVTDIISHDDYYRLASFDPDVAKKRHSDLLAFSKDLHELDLDEGQNLGRRQTPFGQWHPDCPYE